MQSDAGVQTAVTPSGVRVSESWLGKTVGNCRIEQKIGEGGCGQVFRGLDRLLDRTVAIKVLHPALAARDDVKLRFRSEATTLARLSHPNVATLYSLHEVADSYVMVMEYVEGRTFEELLQAGGPMSPGAALPLFLQALEGIHHAHELGVVHRDIKASNLMVNQAGIVKVMDFGVARALGTDGITQANQPIGTPEYMSPEQVCGEEIDRRSDLYSLGILLFKMLSGRLPITGQSPFDVMRAQVDSVPRSLRALVPTLPDPIERAVSRALAKAPEERFPTADAFRAALEEAVDDAGYTAEPPLAPEGESVDVAGLQPLAEETALLEDAGSTLAIPAARRPVRDALRSLALLAVLTALAAGFVRLGEEPADEAPESRRASSLLIAERLPSQSRPLAEPRPLSDPALLMGPPWPPPPLVETTSPEGADPIVDVESKGAAVEPGALPRPKRRPEPPTRKVASRPSGRSSARSVGAQPPDAPADLAPEPGSGWVIRR